jgi:hypothetical protein
LKRGGPTKLHADMLSLDVSKVKDIWWIYRS